VGGHESEVGIVFYHLSRLHLQLGRLGRAEEAALTAVPLIEPGPELASALDILATIFTKAGRKEEATETRERIRLMWISLGKTPPPDRRREASV